MDDAWMHDAGTSANAEPGIAGHARARVSDLADGARNGMEAVGEVAGRTRGAAAHAVDAVTGAASGMAGAVSGVVSDAVDAASRLAGGVSDAAADAASGVAGTADHLLHQGRYQSGRLASSATRGWGRMAEEQPLLMGALGLALGAALGAILPRTRTEDELMGQASDELTERAGTMAHDGMERAAEVAGQQLGRAQAAVADTYAISKDKVAKDGLTADTAGDVIGTAAGRLAEAAKDAVRGVTEEARKGLGTVGEAAGQSGEQFGEGAGAGGPRDVGTARGVGPASAPAAAVEAPTAFPAATPSSGSGSTTRSGPL